MFIHLNNKNFFILSLIIFVLSVFIFFGQHSLNMLGIKNIVFVDGYTHFNAVYDFIHNRRDIFQQRAAWLLPIIYYVPAYILGSFGVLIFNNLLLFIFYKVTLYKKTTLFYSIFFGLFYFLSSFLPNKEIPILLLTALYIIFIFKKKLFLALIIAIVAFSIRDGHGAFLILFLFIYWLKLPRRLVIIGVFLIAYLIDTYLKDIAEITGIFALERTLWIMENAQGEYLSYMLRIIGNVTNFGSRMDIFNGEFLNIVLLSYYLAGILIFLAFVLSLYNLTFKYKKNSLFDNILAEFFILSLLIFSISPLIQPRYLIPIAYIYLIFNSSLRKNSKRLYINFIFSFVFLFILKIIYLNTIGLPKSDIFRLNDKTIYYEGEMLE